MNMPEDIRFLAVEGVIGVGKTSLAKELAKRLNVTLIEEQFNENPFLEKFYEMPEAYAFQTQLFFLLSRHRQFQDTFVQNDLFRNLVISDYTFDKDRIFAFQNLSESELGMYETVSEALSKNAPVPDLIVYLQASVPTLLKRIQKRGRSMERTIEPRYLRELTERYNHHFFHYRESPVLIINTDHIDFVHNEGHLQQVLNAIESCPSQTTYFVPEGG
ncbi:MAG: deoxynucleoside kinase [Fibrobacter sp.]|jgi:deoxyadenosine/deoxycytidine kinase|nr:deoxynucleoside kinase [Fibrobacter sp.]